MGVIKQGFNTKVLKILFIGIVSENFPTIREGNDIQVSELYRNPSSHNLNKFIPRHIILKNP